MVNSKYIIRRVGGLGKSRLVHIVHNGQATPAARPGGWGKTTLRPEARTPKRNSATKTRRGWQQQVGGCEAVVVMVRWRRREANTAKL